MIKELAAKIEEALSGIDYPSDLPNLYDPITYTLEEGGKRLRPLLTLIGAALYGAEPGKAMNQAMGVEIFHNFTLVHDDIMDEAPLRRGKDSVYKKWDSNTAILSGDVMFALAMKFMAKCDKEVLAHVMDRFLEAAVKVCEGQQMDMDFEERDSVSMEEYLHMVGLKTAYLLAAGLEIGALVGGADEKEASLLFDFMMKAGTAFQIMDDYLDAFGDPEKFGKQVGGDILAAKKTCLFIHCLSVASPDDKARLSEIYNPGGERNEASVKEVLDLFRKYEIDRKTLERAGEWMSQAEAVMSQVSGSPEIKRELITLTHQLINRQN